MHKAATAVDDSFAVLAPASFHCIKAAGMGNPSEPDPSTARPGEKNYLDTKAQISDRSDSASGKGVLATKTSGPVHDYGSDDSSSDSVKEVFSVEGFDPVLAKKMALVNEAIDSIGMTAFQWKLFFLNGFGYAVDSVSHSFHSVLAGS